MGVGDKVLKLPAGSQNKETKHVTIYDPTRRGITE